MTCPTKKLGEVDSIWLLRWGCHAHNKKEYFDRIGIKDEVVDIISMRKNLERVLKIVEDIYIREMLTFLERLPLVHYNYGQKNRGEMFGDSVPVYRPEQSSVYKELAKEMQKKDPNKDKIDTLTKKWDEYPELVTIGSNPYLEARKVFDFTIKENDKGKEVLYWKYKLPNGEIVSESYVSK